MPPDAVAFVLGAGPSLDYAFEKIREYQDRAVIFSCGSTIGALAREGIVPDFHVEIERTKYTYDTLAEVDRSFLKRTVLIANNPLWTDCFKLFKKGYMFLKLNDTGAILLEPTGAPIIWHTGPTVTAAGVALAAEFGFKEIYLFGVDLGSKDPKKHHSEKSNYYDPDSMLSKIKVDLDIPLPGNFGGQVYANRWFMQTKYAIEMTIKKKGVKVYNTSDGVKIEGAVPLPIEFFRLESSTNKLEAIKAIESCFDTRYVKMVNPKQVLDKLSSDFYALSHKIKEYPSRFDLSSYTGIAHSLSTLVGDLVSFKNPLLYNLLYHNTHDWSLVAMGHVLSLESPESRREFMLFFYDLYYRFLKEANKEVKRLTERFGRL